ncbi:SigE family RNA polymerase sigma factor [Asanoa iriomotensis]|uniref:DNA-directed RNA polymerase sigma-70 factor n=1 Tax=Asanoa iriomotensis TaxID=234613 RepID=A0ABQ4CH18_9ACTN|nr:SigE family RNA polymerase sigma factor [Asanoa iriomotensis]GIF61615.1 DNA-directed RNA polymerase sigma-70 factor [Asanoa iriomotensis]
MRTPSSVEDEFTVFVTANYGRLLHVADLIVGDAGRAEELLQTVLTRTFLRWSEVRQDNPLGYVRAGLVNGRTDWLRRGFGREQPTETMPAVSLVPDHSEQVVGRDAVQRALAALTRRERAVIVLRYYEDLSEAEIARILDIAAGTVKSTCARALVKLRVSPDLALSEEALS